MQKNTRTRNYFEYQRYIKWSNGHITPNPYYLLRRRIMRNINGKKAQDMLNREAVIAECQNTPYWMFS